jgi:hypothetical protein
MSWAQVARRIRVPMGFAFAAYFLWRARPDRASMGRSLLWVTPGVLLRGYASGCVKKNAALAVSGPYAYTRNPLYLGSMLIAFGFARAARSWGVAAALAGLFAVIYVPVIAAEEEFLAGAFPEFAAYRQRVPRLLPRLTPARLGTGANEGGGFSGALYWQHREYNAALGAVAIYGALWLKCLLGRREPGATCE